MADEELTRLRREVARSPDDDGAALRLAVALARAGEVEAAARAYMKLDARIPETVRRGLGILLATDALPAEDAAWLVTVFGGSRMRILDPAVEVGRAFAGEATPERARAVTLALAKFPGPEFLSVLLAFAQVEALLAPVLDALRSRHSLRNAPRFRHEATARDLLLKHGR